MDELGDDERMSAAGLAAALERAYPDRRPGTAEAVAELADELRGAGIEDLVWVAGALEKARAAVLTYEQECPPSAVDGRFNRVGLARGALLIRSTVYRAHWNALNEERYPGYEMSDAEYVEYADRFGLGGDA